MDLSGDPLIGAVIGPGQAALGPWALAGRSAALAHLGRRLESPLVVACRGRATLPPGIDRLPPLRTNRTLRHADLRVADLETAFCQLCARGDIRLASALLREGSRLERRALDAARAAALALRESQRDPSAGRRAGWLLERAGHGAASAPLLSLHGRGHTRLDPRREAVGSLVTRWRLLVNTADGLDDPSGAVAPLLAKALREAIGPGLDPCAVALGARLPCSGDTLLRAGETQRAVSALRKLVELGWVAEDESGTRCIPPFDAVCLALSSHPRARRRLRLPRLADALEARGDARGLVGAARAWIAAGNPSRAVATLLRRQGLLLVAPVGTIDDDVVEWLDPRVAEQAALRHDLLLRTGRWDQVAEELRDRLAGSPDDRQARLLAARVAWQRGRHGEANSHLAALERTADDGSELDFEAAMLRAALLQEQADWSRAESQLAAALRLADAGGRDHARARCLHRLGTLHVRRGAVLQGRAAYLAALDALARAGGAAELEGVLHSNLALTAHWLGRWDEARDLVARGLEQKRGSASLASLLSTEVLALRIERAASRVGEQPDFEPLARRARELPDARLRCEVHLDLAEQRLRTGSLAAARDALEVAQAATVTLAGAEPVLDALTRAMEALLRAQDRPGSGAHLVIRAAGERLCSLGYRYYAARAVRDAAGAALADHDEPAALEHLARAVELCAEEGYVLGEHLAHVALYALGALDGDRVAGRHADAILADLDPDLVAAALARSGADTLQQRLWRRAVAGEPNVVAQLTSGVLRRGIGTGDLTALRRGPRSAIIVDTLKRELLFPDGRSLPFSHRRVLLPLLVTLAETRGSALTTTELGRRAWGQSSPTTAGVKMAVSRLRRLLAPHDHLIVTAAGPAGPSYRLAGEPAVWVLGEPGPADASVRGSG